MAWDRSFDNGRPPSIRKSDWVEIAGVVINILSTLLLRLSIQKALTFEWLCNASGVAYDTSSGMGLMQGEDPLVYSIKTGTENGSEAESETDNIPRL